jgi:hypothetical protein
MDVLKWFVGLYIDVFKQYPWAASVMTLLFVAAWYVWTRLNQGQGVKAAAVLFAGWFILTPIFGEIWPILKGFVGLYVHVFKLYPAAGAIVTTILLIIYFIWRKVITWKGRRTRGFWSYPSVVLLLTWLVVTPILGLILQRMTTSLDAEPKERPIPTGTP